MNNNHCYPIATLSVLFAACSAIFNETSHAETPPASSAEKNYASAIEYAYGMNKVRIDDAKMVECLRRAAAQGLPEAEVGLASMMKKGVFGVTKDTVKAEELARLSLSHGLAARAKDGRADAQFALARLHLEGLGTGRDLSNAAELLQKAADQGHPVAQNALGTCYEDGIGVTKDLGKAAELYRRAADQGNASAQNNLAVAYETGTGVGKDLNKAVELFEKAGAQGDDTARQNLRRLGK